MSLLGMHLKVQGSKDVFLQINLFVANLLNYRRRRRDYLRQQPTTQTKVLKWGVCKSPVDQPKHFECYVKTEQIGTSGCFTSSDLYGYTLNISDGQEKCVYRKPVINIGDVNHSRKGRTRQLYGRRRKPCWMQYECTKYSPHGLEMLKKQKLCKDYMQGLEPC